uniref:Ribonuclease H protein At1g65750 family n=1 Tax=Cajanus cajan TaxID=3821 RepID=A0A151TM80_CAJCA|nr:Putative ribonuclease H protein At1g65750 family [Cajanus cajan]
MNCDGAMTRDGEAFGGGVVRNFSGDFVVAFSVRLGRCSIIEAELRSILYGTYILLDRNMDLDTLVEFDSYDVVKLLNEGCSRTHPCSHVVRKIRELSSKLPSFSCSYIGREANLVADSLSKCSVPLLEEILIFESPPSFITSLLLADSSAIFFQVND